MCVGEDRKAGLYGVHLALSQVIHEFPIENMKKIVHRFSSEYSLEGNIIPSWTTLNPEWKNLFDGAVVTKEEYAIITGFLGRPKDKITIVTKYVLNVLEPLGISRAQDIIDKSILVGWETTDIDEFEEQVLSDAISFLKNSGIRISREDITVASNSSGVCAGQYINGKIYIDKSSIEKGLDDTIDTLFEEAMHRDSNAADQSLEFQNHLKRKCLHYMRRLALIRHDQNKI